MENWALGRKTNAFVLFFTRFFVTLAAPKLLSLGKAQINLAFRSTFRNFAEKSAKLLRLGKKRNEFLCFALNFS